MRLNLRPQTTNLQRGGREHYKMIDHTRLHRASSSSATPSPSATAHTSATTSTATSHTLARIQMPIRRHERHRTEWRRQQPRRGLSSPPPLDRRFVLQGAWLLLNCGLHDIKKRQMGCRSISTIMSPISRRPLQSLVSSAQPASFGAAPRPSTMRSTRAGATSASLASRRTSKPTTTPRTACAKNSVDVIDLHAFTSALGTDAFSDHVHYTPEACEQQAKFVAAALISDKCRKIHDTHTHPAAISIRSPHTSDRSPKVTQSRPSNSVQQLAAPARPSPPPPTAPRTIPQGASSYPSPPPRSSAGMAGGTHRRLRR